MINYMVEKNFDTKGITLIESALALLVLGLILAGTLALYQQAQKQNILRDTHDKMAAITNALSLYVETAGRLPCPADPSVSDAAFGWEWHVTEAMADMGQTSAPIGHCGGDPAALANDLAGIVPSPMPLARPLPLIMTATRRMPSRA